MKKKLEQQLRISDLEDELSYFKDAVLSLFFILCVSLYAAARKINEQQQKINEQQDQLETFYQYTQKLEEKNADTGRNTEKASNKGQSRQPN